MTRRRQMLEALAIGPLWVRRTENGADALVQAHATSPAIAPAQPAALAGFEVPAPDLAHRVGTGWHSDAEIALMDWESLQSAVAGCTRCRLCETRTRTVFGVGDPKAAWLLVGEGPGRTEDQQGEPFVGPAGKLLDNMLVAMSLRRGRNTFIANAVKCRPADATGKDRIPAADEMAACKPYLKRQIELIGPGTIVALGKAAAIALLECEPSTAVSSLRGIVHRYGPLPLVVTYHPAYLLRAPLDKRKAWEDLCLAMDTQSAVG